MEKKQLPDFYGSKSKTNQTFKIYCENQQQK